MTHQGSCHCGAIAFTLDGEVTEGLDCNCSLCRRRGGLLAFFPGEAFALVTPEEAVSTYTFAAHHIRHHFCATCGIAPFSRGTHPGTGAEMVAVNLRCLPDLDLASITVTPYDGAAA